MKAAIYARVSTDIQVDRDTIQNQLDFARRYCELHEIEVIETYTDPAVSGTVPLLRREAGKRLLEDAAAGRFQTVLVLKLDRFARSLWELLSGIRQLEDCGVALRSMTEPYDTSTIMGKFMVSLLGLLAEWERGLISERTMSGRRRTAESGKWNGGPTPYGYRRGEDGYLEIVEEEAVIIRRIFDLSERGVSLSQIVTILVEEGVPNPNAGRKPGSRWGTPSLHKILRNPIYTGKGAWGKTAVKKDRDGKTLPRDIRGEADRYNFEAPPIITLEQYDRVQAGMSARWHRSRGNAKNEYPLSGLLVCQCGKCYLGTGDSKGRRRYRCSSWQTSPRVPCCGKLLQAAQVEDWAFDRVRMLLSHPRALLDPIETLLTDGIQSGLPLEQETATLEAQIRRLEEKREAVVELYLEGDITKDSRRERLAAIDSEIAHLTDRIALLSTREDQLRQIEIRLMQMEKFLVERAVLINDPKELVDALHLLGVRINVETEILEGKKRARYQMVIGLDRMKEEVCALAGLGAGCAVSLPFTHWR